MQGGAALEYLVVSLFGFALAATATHYVHTVLSTKIASIEEQTGVPFNFDLKQLFKP